MPLLGGAVISFAAALIQALLFVAGGPQAYGFCVACHSRDLINYVYNSFTGSNLFLAPFSANPVAAGTLPVLTIIGVLVGAVAAAVLYKESIKSSVSRKVTQKAMSPMVSEEFSL